MMNIILVEAGGVTLYIFFRLNVASAVHLFVVPSPTDSPRVRESFLRNLWTKNNLHSFDPCTCIKVVNEISIMRILNLRFTCCIAHIETHAIQISLCFKLTYLKDSMEKLSVIGQLTIWSLNNRSFFFSVRCYTIARVKRAINGLLTFTYSRETTCNVILFEKLLGNKGNKRQQTVLIRITAPRLIQHGKSMPRESCDTHDVTPRYTMRVNRPSDISSPV